MSRAEMTFSPPQSNMADFSPLSTNPHPPHDVIHPTWPTFCLLSTNPDPRIKTRLPSLDQWPYYYNGCKLSCELRINYFYLFIYLFDYFA